LFSPEASVTVVLIGPAAKAGYVQLPGSNLAELGSLSGSIETQYVPGFRFVNPYEMSVVIVSISSSPSDGHAPAPSLTLTPPIDFSLASISPLP
jgi:hypothetical protein